MTRSNSFKTAASAIALSLALSGFTVAAQTGSNGQSKFDTIDTSGDGVISLAELQDSTHAKFNRADINADGFLSTDERKAAREARNAERKTALFDAKDANGDGVLSRDEATTDRRTKNAERSNRNSRSDRSKSLREQIKAKIDTNDDGTIDAAEKDAARAALRERRSGDRTNRTNRADQANRINVDSNNDKLISLTELDVATQVKFTQLDDNNDGVLSSDELRGNRGGKNRHGGAKGGRR